MSCKVIPFPGGAAVICTRGVPRPKCGIPHCTREAVATCDFPITKWEKFVRCSMNLCETHRNRKGPDVDYCVAHQLKSQQQRNPRKKIREPRFKSLRG